MILVLARGDTGVRTIAGLQASAGRVPELTTRKRVEKRGAVRRHRWNQ